MIKRELQSDINEIKELLSNPNSTEEELKELHIKMDGKYQSKISNWGLSCYNWNKDYGFIYEYTSKDSLKHNLINMQRKIEGYLQDFSLVAIPTKKENTFNFYNENKNANTNNVQVQIEIDFEVIEKNISEMESLTNEETAEALRILEELKEIYKSKENRKSKWEKTKKFFLWLSDKSVDVAIAFIPIINQILSQN